MISHQINNLLPGLVNISIATRSAAVSQLDSTSVYDITMHCLQDREEGVGGVPMGDPTLTGPKSKGSLW